MKPSRRVKRTREEAKAALQTKTEAALDEFWQWVEQTPAPNLTQIEDAVLKFRQHIGQAMAEAVIQSQEQVQPSPGPNCLTCQREMQLKGPKAKTVTARVGALPLERNYYYCPHCQEGLFPPGRTTTNWG